MNRLQLHFFSEHIKEAEKKKKKEGLNKMQQAALLGGGAALVGLGGLGYALRKGVKETDKIVKGTEKSLKKGQDAMDSYDSAVKGSKDVDKLTRKAAKKEKKNIQKMNIMGKEVEVDMDNGDMSRMSNSSGFGD